MENIKKNIKKDVKKNISINISLEYDRILQILGRIGYIKSRSEFIRDCIETFLANEDRKKVIFNKLNEVDIDQIELIPNDFDQECTEILPSNEDQKKVIFNKLKEVDIDQIEIIPNDLN